MRNWLHTHCRLRVRRQSGDLSLKMSDGISTSARMCYKAVFDP